MIGFSNGLYARGISVRHWVEKCCVYFKCGKSILLLRDSKVDLDLHSDKRPRTVRAGMISACAEGPKQDCSA